MIHSAILQNFRNYSFRQFEFSGKINFFLGENGAGKTNLLEAISLLGIQGGIRGAENTELNQHFTKPFSLGFETSIGSIGIKNSNGAKRFFAQNEGVKLSFLESNFKTISIAPEDEFIFKASVSERRRFFDCLLSKISKTHGIILKEYKELCTQRSKILSSLENQNAWLEVIERQIAQKLVIISTNRVMLSEELSSIMYLQNPALRGEILLTGYLENKIKANEFVSSKEEENLTQYLKDSRQVDNITGKTLTKLAKTNFDVMFLQKSTPATQSSSGEQKKMLFSVCLSAVKLTNAKLTLIDEVASKFDDKNRDIILSALSSTNSQIFLTGTNIKGFEHFNVIEIK